MFEVIDLITYNYTTEAGEERQLGHGCIIPQPGYHSVESKCTKGKNQ
jgi:hypothetical protein